MKGFYYGANQGMAIILFWVKFKLDRIEQMHRPVVHELDKIGLSSLDT